MVKRSPFAWKEAKALNFPGILGAVSKNHPKDHPVSATMIAIIFFEETAFCNIEQAGTKGTLGIGFGQIEVSNPEKKKFYAWAGVPTDYNELAKQMLADKDFSIKVHCKFFQWLTDQDNPDRKTSLEGCLAAQIGTHTEYKDLFIAGEKQLKTAMDKKNFIDCARALNYARQYSSKSNGIPVTGKDAFTDFWKYILPDSYFQTGS